MEKVKKDDPFNYSEYVECFIKTKGHKKILNYIEESFKRGGINRIRKRYGIPEDGFKNEEEYKKWEEETPKGVFLNIGKEMDWLFEKINIFNFEGQLLLREYFYFNSFESPDLHCVNLCLLSDVYTEKIEPYGKETVEGDDKMFPIYIRISPYASQRDIIDFVKKVYNIGIKPIQDSYKEQNVLLGKIKSRNPFIKERNEFIYKNRNLPRRKIKELVEKKFKIGLDYEYIGKIISDENKTRKKV